MNIHIIQHVPFENPGLILKWVETHQHTAELVKVYENEKFPAEDDISFLIVLGGPMSALDPEPWIQEERDLIKQVVEKGKPMLGICLGAQQLAKAFGGKIVPSPREVGWGKVTSLTKEFCPKDYTVLHWHGEGFTLPESAEKLFSSERWMNQGFRIHNAVGLQFHFETTKETVREIAETDSAFLEGSVFDTSLEETIKFPIPGENEKCLFEILNILEKNSNSK